MKKLSALFVVCLALFVSVFFGACGSKYKKLDMYFLDEKDCIQLIMDDEYNDFKNVPKEERDVLDVKTVKVEIDGIKKKYIGKLDIKVIPSDLAVVKENEVIDTTLYFKIYASRPGTGEVQVTHLASGKSVSINLSVDKKAISATSKNKGIVVNLPEENVDGSESFYTYTIDSSSVLNYTPFDATDDVNWEIVGSKLNNVELGSFSEEENALKVNNQIKVSSKAMEGTFYITPTLIADGYEDIKLEDIKIPVSIIKVVDETSLRVLSENAITTSTDIEIVESKNYKVLTDPIYLFTNSLVYGNAKLFLYTHESINILANEDYMRFYTYEIETSSTQIDVKPNNIEHCIDVTGIDYNENLQWIKISFAPNNSVGDIKSFAITQEIILTEVADKIAIKMDNEMIATTEKADGNASIDIDLLDYYEKYGNLGQKFNFSVYRTSTHNSLKNLRIVVNENYYDENLTTDKYEGNENKNKYLLDFKKGNVGLKFTNNKNGYYVSETFTAGDNLYIKYAYNPSGNTAQELSFVVKNEYSKEPFGENVIQNTEKELEIHINRGRGIKSMSLVGGAVVNSKDDHLYPVNRTQNGLIYVLNSAIANENILDYYDKTFRVKEGQVAYGIQIEEITGTTSISDEEIKDVNFKCRVVKDKTEVDLFDFALFSSNGDIGEIISKDGFEITSISSGVINTLLLIKKADVIPNGEYIVEISEPIGGYKVSFTYSVVTNVEVENANITPFNPTDITKYNKIYSANEYRDYLFSVLDAEYVKTLDESQQQYLNNYLDNNIFIVPTKQDINTTIKFGRNNNGDFVLDDSFIPYVKDIQVKAKPVSLVYNTESNQFVETDTELLNVNYISNDRDSLIGDFKFDVKLQTGEYGTIHNGQKQFMKVTYQLYSDKYEMVGNFYQKVDNKEPAEISFYFFIYVELKETKFKDDTSIINTYFYDDLGYHYQEKFGVNTLTLSLPNQYGKSQNNMFDYVDYKWVVNQGLPDFDYTENTKSHSLTFSLKKPTSGKPSYNDRTIKAEITQFGVKRTLVCTVHVHKVKLTEKLVVRNSLNYLSTTENYYVYLKDGGNFTFEVEQVGNPTFKGIKYVVCDVAGNVADYIIDENNTLKYGGQGSPTIKDLKVLIFATDWATRNLDSKYNKYDFNNLSYYTEIGGNNYADKVVIIDVKIRDGSENNPYLVADSNDFIEINNSLNKHYEVVNDINLSGKDILINEFSGSLSSYKDYKMLSKKPNDWATNYYDYYTYDDNNDKFVKISKGVVPTFTNRKYYQLKQNVYTIYNILFGKNYNLFTSILEDGKLSDISFRIGFNNAKSNVGYIGLIATNYGTLKNVKVEYSGNITIQSCGDVNKDSINIGMLVAQNFSNIVYDNTSTVYSSGNVNITIDTAQSVNIGGLVGENTTKSVVIDGKVKNYVGLIKGVLIDSSLTTNEYVLFYENQGSLFDGNITLKVSKEENKEKLVLGGVVGYNNNGKIKQVFTSGKLNGFNNVGGLIGKNNQTTILTEIATSGNAYIVDCLSTTKILAENNVGGITGYDTYGSYYHVYYEVYNDDKPVDEKAYSIKANLRAGGLIGNAVKTQLNFCYFHSFRWNYEFGTQIFAESEFASKTPDIYATKYVGGLIGYADSSGNSNHLASVGNAVYIINSVADTFVMGQMDLAVSPTFVGGLIGYANGYAVSNTTYVQGAFIGNAKDFYYDMIVCVDDNVIVSEPDRSKTHYYNYVFGNKKNEINNINEITYINSKDYENLDDTTFKIDPDINNKRPYIELNGIPLITQAPTKIILDNALNGNFDRGTNIFNDNSNIANAGITYTDKILIYYYNLINNNQTNYINDSASINTINLDEIVVKGRIGILPDTIKGARIKVTSSDESVIVITASGYIKLVGEGVATLRFASIIDLNVFDELTIIVRSMPSSYDIYKNSAMNDSLNDGSISIVKGESKFIYENYVGQVFVNGTEYLYNTTNSVAVFTNIFTKDEDGKPLFVQDGKISINGTIFDSEIEENKQSFIGKEPIIISVLEYSEDDYTVTMSSYVKFELKVEEKTELYYVLVGKREFTLVTKRGITSINTNVTDALMSVADKLNVGLRIGTDIDENIINISVDVRDQYGRVAKIEDFNGNEVNKNNLFTYDSVSLTEFNIDKSGIKDFELRINQNVRIKQDLYVTITFSSGSIKSEMYLTLIPQKITSIVANAYKQDSSNWKSSSVIRPGEPGIFVIDVAPDTAYFEYLEITDMSSEEKITFIQWSDFDADDNGFVDTDGDGVGAGHALNEVDTPSSDGFGVRLTKTDKESFYVYALLSKYAINSVAHEIVITAYSSSGYILGSSSVNLEAMLYPTVILSYYNEKDEVEITADSRDGIQNKSTDLAVGIQAKIGVTTYNTDGSFDNASWVIEVEEKNELAQHLSMQLSENGYWYLTYDKSLSLDKLNGVVEELVGKTIIITANVRQVTKGFEERSSAKLSFKCKQFTINGISAQTARQTSGNRIAGIVNEETYLEFYFNNTHNKDVSYYKNGEYFNKNYFVDFNEYEDSVNAILRQINNFNTIDEIVIVKLIHNQTKEEINLTKLLKGNTEYVHTINGDVDLFKITKINNELTKFVAYSSNINNYKLSITLRYHYNHLGEVVVGLDDDKKYQTLTSEYAFNFVTNSSPLNYYPIRNSAEFMDMVQGQYYILINDITLKNYKMLDVKIGGFDGNGHTITIDSFDYESLSNVADGTTGYLGLFKQVYPGAIVENLIVNYTYRGGHYDLSQHYVSDNTDYTEFYFGGITAINAGIITNCKVEGSVYLQTSKISPAYFYLGGLVAQNQSTAFITNSTVELEMNAGGRIGGIAHTNEGKIVSSNFLGSVKAYTSTNTSLSNEINAALFVVNNAGEISMSYVSPRISKDNTTYVEGTGLINSGGSLGGFVYENSGRIYDCYLKDITFSSRGYMGGFVYSSSGTIERCYVNSNDSLQGDRYVDIFVYDKTAGTFIDCYYILAENLKSQIDGIKCITVLDMNKESFYNNYAFNSDGYSVWVMTSEGPVIKNAGANIHQKHVDIKVENGVEKVIYSISGTKDIPYVIYDVASFTYWFSLVEDGVIYNHYRFVADIDFSTLQEIITTSNKVFSGTIEGNNMMLSNFSLFAPKDLDIESVGLFKEINHTSKSNYVNNLVLNCTSVRAASASCVGVLAGIINGGNIYGIKIDSPGLVVLGKNAVGGLAGLIKGNYIIENISSNVSVNASFRQTVLSKVNIYNGRYNTGTESSNINEVSYAGGIAGILEGYDYRINSNVILNNYYMVKNSLVSGDVTLIGETVGGAFGLVNERARVSNVTFDAGKSAYLQGIYYSGGLVGENRGIIDNSIVKANLDNITLFDTELDGKLASCVGGITAVNYNGLLYNCKNYANVISMYLLSTAGGITGRNVGGSINYCENEGVVYGFFSANISGADYDYKILAEAGNSAGTITASSINAINRTETYSNIEFDGKKAQFGYLLNVESLDKWYTEHQKKHLDLIYKEISSFYTHKIENKGTAEEELVLVYSRILGAVIGLTNKKLEYNIPESGNIVLSVIKEEVSENYIVIESSSNKNFKSIDDLKVGLYDGSISDYYYLVPVFDVSAYDFYNLTGNGYEDTFARVIQVKK